MTRRILVIDAIATRRIVMKAKLGAAQYDVSLAADFAEAQHHMSTSDFDVIFVDKSLDGDASTLAGFCAGLKSKPATQNIPLIMLADPLPEEEVLAAFAAGFDEVIMRPLSERVLLAQLRALMRRDIAQDTNRETGFLNRLPDLSEAPPRPARLAIVAADRDQARELAVAMTSANQTGTRFHILAENHAWIVAALRNEPDLDAVLLVASPNQEEAALNLLSDLRSRGAARGAGLILALGPEKSSYAARAFDLGADNVVPSDSGARELARRAERLVRIKRRRDALNRRVRDGLRMAITDPLTGIHNRRFATERLAQLAQDDQDFAVLMLDIDHFKQVNDMHGHGVGDLMLARIAAVLKANLRDSDLLARMGGEEFLIALPGASPAQAMGTAERLRRVIDLTHIRAPNTGDLVKATLSIGLVHNGGAKPDVDLLIARADEALYRAKSDGRNMVSVSEAA